MNVGYTKRFLKDVARIPAKSRIDIERFVFIEVPLANSFGDIGKFEKIKGYASCYKARFGNYRIGIRVAEDTIIFERALHRKEIYRYFP